MLGERFSKRMFFKSKLNEKDVFKENINLIGQKVEHKKLHSLISQKNDVEYIDDMDDYNQHEKYMDQLVKEKFKHDYTEYNANKAKIKQKLTDKNFNIRRQENFEFFPFTEGEKVEQGRIEQKKELNRELRDREKQMKMPKINRTSASRDTRRYRSTINTRRHSPGVKVNNLLSPTINSSVGFNMVDNNGGSSVVNTPYPKFLENHKHYPYRRLDDTHVENVMQDAIKRVEDQVKDIVIRRTKQSKDFDDKFSAILKSTAKHELLKQKDTKVVHEYQQNQIQQKAKVNKFFLKEDKKPQNIYYGPDDSKFQSKTYKEATSKYDAEKMRKTDLKRQIEEKRRIQNKEKQIDRLQEIDNLWVSGKVMAKEFKEARDKEKFARETCKNIWKEQMKINKKRNIIRTEGGEKI
jgi:hypothetical protein